MKGVYLDKPPKPKYSELWDVKVVLNYLKTLHPLQSLSLKQLTLKLVTLLALTTAQRAQTLSSLNLDFMIDKGTTIIFKIPVLLKTSKPGKNMPVVTLHKFSDDSLCVVNTLKHYLRQTNDKRKSRNLLVSFVTFQKVTTCTISRWLKTTLSMSGIDTSFFSGHSTRGASASCAFLGKEFP